MGNRKKRKTLACIFNKEENYFRTREQWIVEEIKTGTISEVAENTTASLRSHNHRPNNSEAQGCRGKSLSL